MITIISKSDFNTVPWKNGKGQTVELAINEGGTLEKFDWRLSMATVVEDGEFSNFSGYERNLVLIEGNGLTLTHDIIHTDRLTKLLDFATFDGGSKTQAQILNGSIKDFNIMTAKGVCQATVSTYQTALHLPLNRSGLTFIYSLASDVALCDNNGSEQTITQGDLLTLNGEDKATISGDAIILIEINYS